MININEEDKLLLSRLEDLCRASDKYQRPMFSGFLSLHEQELAKRHIKKGQCNISFFGGAGGCERKMLCASQEETDYEYGFPMAFLKITCKDICGLTHRDVLGSIMSLGIKREKIGDIIFFADSVVVMCDEKIAVYLKDNLLKIKNTGIAITVSEPYNITLPPAKTTEIKGTVASLRLDSVVSLAFSVSRQKSCDAVKAGLVQLNFMEEKNVSAKVSEGDFITFRKMGRVCIREASHRTKKDRIFITIDKFI